MWDTLDRPSFNNKFQQTLRLTELVMEMSEECSRWRIAIIKDLTKNIPGLVFKVSVVGEGMKGVGDRE